MQSHTRPYPGWPIYGPPVIPPARASFTPPPHAPRLDRPIRLPPLSSGEERSHNDHAPIALQVPLISNIIYDIRLPPSCLRSAPNAPLRIASSADLDIPFAPSRPASIRIISREFPWAIAVSEGTRGAGVSCWEVLVALYDSLQMPLADHEWGFSSDDLRQRMVRAWKLRESAGSGQAALLKRVDLLGGRCMLQGFRRDGEFTAQRLYPGTRLVPDTWTVCFVHKIN